MGATDCMQAHTLLRGMHTHTQVQAHTPMPPCVRPRVHTPVSATLVHTRSCTHACLRSCTLTYMQAAPIPSRHAYKGKHTPLPQARTSACTHMAVCAHTNVSTPTDVQSRTLTRTRTSPRHARIHNGSYTPRCTHTNAHAHLKVCTHACHPNVCGCVPWQHAVAFFGCIARDALHSLTHIS